MLKLLAKPLCDVASANRSGGSLSNCTVPLCWYSNTAILKHVTSSLLISLLNHNVSSLICLISYRPLLLGVTLMAEVRVSKEDLDCDVGKGDEAIHWIKMLADSLSHRHSLRRSSLLLDKDLDESARCICFQDLSHQYLLLL